VVGAPTRLHFTVGLPHDVDALKDAAKAKFVQLPANVAASQLSVSVTRGWDKLNEDALVDSLPQGATRQQPLYIHAPAPPQEQRRKRELQKMKRVQSTEHMAGSAAVPSSSITSWPSFAWLLLFPSWQPSKGGLSQHSSSLVPSSASHAGSSSQCTAISSKGHFAAENSPLLTAHTAGGCTRRNQRAFPGE